MESQGNEPETVDRLVKLKQESEFEAEEVLKGENLDVRVFKSAAEIARKVDAMSDAYVTSSYRQRLAATLVERALVQAAERVSRGEN